MSAYEDYTRISRSYDATRTAVGHEIWLGSLLAHFRDIGKVSVLDAGCGTGNYSAALAPFVGHLTALDLNSAMLEKAGEKLAQPGAKAEIRSLRGSVLDMPVEDNSFDVVMFNQVLHHLDTGERDGFPGCRRAVSEAWRALRPGGVILVNACSRRQLQGGFWYYHLAPQAFSRVVGQQVSTRQLRDCLEAAGFSVASRTAPLEATMTGRAYFETDGPLDETWRAGDSFWALASDPELASALETVTRLQAEDRLTEFFTAHDAQRPYLGQMTFWVAVKPAA